MSSNSFAIGSFSPGQSVGTSFGPGIVSAVSYIDSIVYVALLSEPSALYLLRPEQIGTSGTE